MSELCIDHDDISIQQRLPLFMHCTLENYILTKSVFTFCIVGSFTAHLNALFELLVKMWLRVLCFVNYQSRKLLDLPECGMFNLSIRNENVQSMFSIMVQMFVNSLQWMFY